MSDNMKIYNAVREVPKEAQKAIGAGRLRGMTDINPMWRIQTLTEQFGAVGTGWYYDIVNFWTEPGANDEMCANVIINLYVKNDGEWSKPIVGIGGSKYITTESKGLYTSDEAFKMALTDAISVACKALGIGADVYWSAGRTKYSDTDNSPQPLNDSQKKILEQFAANTYFVNAFKKQISEMNTDDFGIIGHLYREYKDIEKYIKAYANTLNMDFDKAFHDIEDKLGISLIDNLDKGKSLCKKIQELAGK